MIGAAAQRDHLVPRPPRESAVRHPAAVGTHRHRLPSQAQAGIRRGASLGSRPDGHRNDLENVSQASHPVPHRPKPSQPGDRCGHVWDALGDAFSATGHKREAVPMSRKDL